ncbi:hypothetical protein [Pseudomonas sp. MWU12-2345]|uniref:hypothetical protein n=1 Tax=Pseudomonas sp. MWU12-2345 TaxID=2928689 RepID=UPI00200C7F85|nr:hypothetical protein [Pseudomonas sp. MWU12-2345]
MNNLSDLFFAIGDAILAADIGVLVGNYNDFDGTVGDSTVLIEIENTQAGVRSQDGRKSHIVTVTLHAVVGRWRKHANLEAANLATLLERLATDNRWGLPSVQCGLPDRLSSGPTMFEGGQGGYEAWGVNFQQFISIGAVLLEDPVMEFRAPPLVARSWEVTGFDDPGQYQQLEV